MIDGECVVTSDSSIITMANHDGSTIIIIIDSDAHHDASVVGSKLLHDLTTRA